MALTSSSTRAIITDDGPLAEAIEWKAHATVLLNDVAAIQGHMHSSGPHILLAHAIELLLKAYLKGVDALKPRRKADKESYGHEIDELLKEAQAKGLKLSDPDTKESATRLAQAIRKARLRYVFTFQDVPFAMDGLRVARAIEKDISALVKLETPEEIQKRRAAEKAKREEERTRVVKLPGT